jgi:uncharacterized protein (TIGR03382 family)
MRLITLTLSTLALAATPLLAQAPPSGECTGDSTDPACGAPEQTGGGGCGCGGGSILIAFTDQGDSYQYADDFDDDGVEDGQDKCPFNFDPDQADSDGDGFGDACDFCPDAAATLVDGVAIQRDTDADGIGDECDDDADGDGVANTEDNCPLQAAANCTDDLAVVPDECFPDQDADGIEDVRDNCVGTPNEDQADTDNDTIGDACDQDLDNDGIDNRIDNCVQVPNADQANEDRDSLGDACDNKLCYVVDGDEQNCLDPVAPFAVHPSIAEQRLEAVETGDDVLLHIFANRENKAIRYTWTIVEQPTDGDATITEPKGGVSFSKGIQYVYESDRRATFSATSPGTYTVELLAELAFRDELGYDVKSAKGRMTIDVGGSKLPNAFGCTQSGGMPWMAAGLMGLAFGLRRRRRG